MAAECPFCAIVAGDIPARIVDRRDGAIAFLDANPLTAGHTLIIPTTHSERLADLSPEDADAVYGLLHRLTPAVQRAVDADGLTVGINDGTAAGQEVPHVHVHLVPRDEGDGNAPIHALFDERPDLMDDELDRIAGAIADAVEG